MNAPEGNELRLAIVTTWMGWFVAAVMIGLVLEKAERFFRRDKGKGKSEKAQRAKCCPVCEEKFDDRFCEVCGFARQGVVRCRDTVQLTTGEEQS